MRLQADGHTDQQAVTGHTELRVVQGVNSPAQLDARLPCISTCCADVWAVVCHHRIGNLEAAGENAGAVE